MPIDNKESSVAKMDKISVEIIPPVDAANTGSPVNNPDDHAELSVHHRDNTCEGRDIQGSRDLIVSGTTSNNIQQNCVDSFLPGFASLRRQVSHRATVNAVHRYYEGRFHPDTRKTIIREIVEWVSATTPGSNILWIHGTIGTSIAQTIAEFLSKDCKKLYGGSFFFPAGVPGRDKGSLLFPSLAYQIGVNFPEIRDRIDEAMKRDCSLPTRTMDVQLRTLLVEPLLSAPDVIKAHPPTVVIGGFDQCFGQDIQSKILTLIGEALLISHIPLRFIIAGRESWVRDAFCNGRLLPISKSIYPKEAAKSNRDMDLDMAKFFRIRLKDVADRKWRIMGGFERPWPTDEVIEELVRQASGQVLYASSVVRFIDAPNHNPIQQLNILLTLGPTRKNTLCGVDGLYRKIFSVYPDQEVLKTVLAGIVCRLSPRAIQVLLDVDYSDVVLVLDHLCSLVEVHSGSYFVDDMELENVFGTPDSLVRTGFCHCSVAEFVTDKIPFGGFLNLELYVDQILTHYFEVVIECLEGGFYEHEIHPDIQPNLYHHIHQHHINQLYSSLPKVGQSRVDGQIIAVADRLIAALEKFLDKELPPPDQLGTILQYTGYFGDVLKHTPTITALNNAQSKIIEGMISCGTFQISPTVSILLSKSLSLYEISNILSLPVTVVKEELVQSAAMIESTVRGQTRGYRLRDPCVTTSFRDTNLTQYRLHRIFLAHQICLILQGYAEGYKPTGQIVWDSSELKFVMDVLSDLSPSDLDNKDDWENSQLKLFVELQLDPQWLYAVFKFACSMESIILPWSLRQMEVGILQSTDAVLSKKLLNPFIFASYRYLHELSMSLRCGVQALGRSSFEISPKDSNLFDFLFNLGTLNPKDVVYVARDGSFTNEGCCLITWILSVLLMRIKAAMDGPVAGSRLGVSGSSGSDPARAMDCFFFRPRKELLLISIRHLQSAYVTKLILQPIRSIYSHSLRTVAQAKLFLPYGFKSKISDYLKKFPTHILPGDELERLEMWLLTQVHEADDYHIGSVSTDKNGVDEDMRDQENEGEDSTEWETEEEDSSCEPRKQEMDLRFNGNKADSESESQDKHDARDRDDGGVPHSITSENTSTKSGPPNIHFKSPEEVAKGTNAGGKGKRMFIGDENEGFEYTHSTTGSRFKKMKL